MGARPQYAVGHLDRVVAVRAALPKGIAVAGAAYDGVGIPACIASARRAIVELGATGVEKLAHSSESSSEDGSDLKLDRGPNRNGDEGREQS
jgi:oxygen-dependent protoporphyrinogen oxidase